MSHHGEYEGWQKIFYRNSTNFVIMIINESAGVFYDAIEFFIC